MGTRIIFHKNCADGYTAAWLTGRALYERGNRDLTFHTCGYSGRDKFIEDNISKFEGDDLLILDFSFKRDTLVRLANVSKSILLLDHHKTAVEDLAGFDSKNAVIRFDQNECGASLTWQHFWPGTEIPKLVQYVKDRDLWLWKLPYSQQVNAYIRSFPYNNPAWDKIQYDIDNNFNGIVDQGGAILRHSQRMIEMVAEHAKPCWILGYRAIAINNSMLISEIGDHLKEEADVVIIYSDNNKGGTVVSLRSKEVDVAKIAEHFGGGGHKYSASFTEEFHTPHVWEMYSKGPVECQNSHTQLL